MILTYKTALSYFYVGLKPKIIFIFFGTKEPWIIKNLKSISSYLESIYSSIFLQKYLLYVVHFYDFRYLWNHKKSKNNILEYEHSMNLIMYFIVFYKFTN